MLVDEQFAFWIEAFTEHSGGLYVVFRSAKERFESAIIHVLSRSERRLYCNA